MMLMRRPGGFACFPALSRAYQPSTAINCLIARATREELDVPSSDSAARRRLSTYIARSASVKHGLVCERVVRVDQTHADAD